MVLFAIRYFFRDQHNETETWLPKENLVSPYENRQTFPFFELKEDAEELVKKLNTKHQLDLQYEKYGVVQVLIEMWN